MSTNHQLPNLLIITALARRHPVTPAQRRVLGAYATYARKQGLKLPTGRAAYAVNRIWQVGGRACTCDQEPGALAPGVCHHITREYIIKCQLNTAQKWGEQFHAGVNLRRSIAAWLVWEAEQEAPALCVTPAQHRDHQSGTHATRREADNCRSRWYQKLKKDNTCPLPGADGKCSQCRDGGTHKEAVS